MLYIKKGNIFNTKMQCIVNPVNTDGVMGAGLALVFKKKFPDMYESYKKICQNNELVVGKPQLFIDKTNNTYILNFPTKKHWWEPSKIEYIEEGLSFFCSNLNLNKIRSIAFPALGCGKGNLSWSDVKKIMIKHLKKLPIDVEIYEPM